MKMKFLAAAVGLSVAALTASTASAEILAMMNYESKPAESLKALKLGGDLPRREGIAIIDVDPKSPTFGKQLIDVPLPADLVAHHIFYDRTMTKAYVTALGKSELRVFRMDQFPYRLKTIAVPGCKMGEDVVFDEANKTWYLTCMNSANVIVGDVATDTVTKTISIPNSYPHGLAVATPIDRILVTSTISGDLKTPHDFLSVLEASSGKVLGQLRMSTASKPKGEAPVEILFVPGQKNPVAYVTNMFGASLWTASWEPKTKSFKAAEAYNFKNDKAGVPLEIYFNDAADRMYVTTSSPGNFHIFDISGDVTKPKLLKTIKTGEGAHHVGFTKDFSMAFVQNAFINLPGMREGSVTVIDLKTQKVVASMDTLRNAGYNPNSLVLLPKWNHLAGH